MAWLAHPDRHGCERHSSSRKLRTFIDMSNVDIGVPAERVLTMRVPLSAQRYPEADQRIAFYRELLPRLTAIPSGCAFHPRCVYAFDRCPRERPDLLPAGTSMAACWLHDPASARRVGPFASIVSA